MGLKRFHVPNTGSVGSVYLVNVIIGKPRPLFDGSNDQLGSRLRKPGGGHSLTMVDGATDTELSGVID